MLRTLYILVFFFTLLGCSGSGDPIENSPGLNISAQTSDGTLITSVTVGENITISASLNDSSGQGLESQTITFSTTSGTLSSNSRLTDQEGKALVVLNSATAESGVTTITASTTVDEETFTSTIKLDVSAKAINGDIDSFDFGEITDNVFTSGLIHADSNLLVNDITTIGAGSSFGVSVAIVDQDYTTVTSTPFEVSFTSTCVAANKATIDAKVFSIKGLASATYQDINCAGPNGNEDNIVATVTIDSTQYIASRNIILQPEGLGSIEFISADPESIVLKGVGGENKQESSTLTFLVKGQLGNPQAQKEVSFELSTQIGGISLIAQSATTNENGLVTATVISGSAPTALRVTATVTNINTSISTQSDLLSVNTGLPDQNSMTLAFSLFNPEGRNFAGEEVTVTAYLADSFNNPVPDGTTINFTTEGGAIEPSCNIESGRCSVIWNSQEPHADDHRVTVLATAVGHEYFVDVDGNNYYNDLDGSAIDGSNKLSSGFFGIPQLTTGFVDMSEAWRDDNENYQYDLGEQFLDDDNLGTFTPPDSLFNGPQCNASSCSGNSLITIRKAGYIITSGSTAYFSVENESTGDVYYDDFGGTVVSPIPANTDIIVKISDSALQTLPIDTNIYISTIVTPDGSGVPNYTIGNTVGTTSPNTFGGVIHKLNTGASAITLSILVETPKSVRSTFSLDIN